MHITFLVDTEVLAPEEAGLDNDGQRFRAGLYELVCDIQNPAPDRRARRDWTKAVSWPKGSLFTVYPDPKGKALRVRKLGEDYAAAEYSVLPAVKALLPALRRKEPTNTRELFAGEESVWLLRGTLDLLIASGKVSMADVLTAAREAYQKEDSE